MFETNEVAVKFSKNPSAIEGQPCWSIPICAMFNRLRVFYLYQNHFIFHISDPISYFCDKNKNIEPYPSTTDDPASLWKQEYLGHVWTCFVCVTPPKTNMSLTQRGRFTRKVVFQPLRFSRDTSVFVFFQCFLQLPSREYPGISPAGTNLSWWFS